VTHDGGADLVPPSPEAASQLPHRASNGTPRVLFVSEAVTLAHVARPVALARDIAALGWTPLIAADRHFDAICPTGEWQREPLESISTARFAAALSKGAPIYDRATFDRYVEDDLALLRRTRPAVVVGDFRLSLSISARRAGVPYINITNAYWSPYARPQWHVPALPWTRFVPPPWSDLAFRAVRPLAFRLHAKAMEQCRRANGLPALGTDLLRHYTDGDVTLYADTPELVPVFDAPASHRYLGSVPWSPSMPLPDWWDGLDLEHGVIYVTLGSSGSAARLPQVIEGLSRLGLPVVVATAGAPLPTAVPKNVHLAAYLPGDRVAAKSRLVVCNGGSPTSQQALMQGVPVLALPSNLDQFLNSSYLKAAGVGEWLRPERGTADAIEALGRRLLADGQTQARARAIGKILARHRPIDVLAKAIDDLTKGLVGRVGLEPTTKGL
jgi:UDP:flavonoid glycosyltransferase YjiC (YdhE family)